MGERRHDGAGHQPRTEVAAGVLTGGSGNLVAILAPGPISLREGQRRAADTLAELRDEDEGCSGHSARAT